MKGDGRTCLACNQHKGWDQFAKNGKHRHPRCRPCMSLKVRQDRMANPEKYREQDRKRYERDRPKRRAANKEYCDARLEERRSYNRDLYHQDAERRKAVAKRYRQANREKVYAWNGTRRAATRCAMPPWADKAGIAAIYAEAAKRRRSGEDCHVDHVVPLSHPLICGLHVVGNLAIIAAGDNLAKSNRWHGDS